MSDKNDKGEPVGKSLSDSLELFDDIFSEESTADSSDAEEKKADAAGKPSKEKAKPSVKRPDSAIKSSKEKAKPSVKEPDSASESSIEKAKPSAGRRSKGSKVKSTSTAKSKAGPGKKPKKTKAKKSVSSIDKDQVAKEEDVKEGKRIKKRPDTMREADRQRKVEIPLQAKPKKRSNPLVLILAIVVLFTLTGFLINYYGIVDFKNLIGSSIGSTEPVKKVKIRQRIAKKGQDKPVSKKLNTPSKRKEKENLKPKTKNSLKTPQAKKAQEKRIVKKLSTPSKVKEPGRGKKKIQASLKTPQSKKTTPGIKKKPAVTIHAGKSPDKKISDLRERTASYPYSVYLGSFRTLKGVHTTVSQSRKIGLSPYWIKLDLGEKGTWFRIFAGYFETRKGADTFIKVRKIGGAESRHTKYANLIGTYTSAGVLDKKQTALLELGYSPYVINEKKDVLRLYVGAFYQKVRAEKQNAVLASKGIQSQLVRR
jgi:hypothetical protein